MSQWRMGRVLALGWAGQSSTLGIHLFFSKISTHLKYDLIFTKKDFPMSQWHMGRVLAVRWAGWGLTLGSN